MSIKIEVNMTNKWLYSLIFLGALLVLGVVVYAQNPTAPNPGHEATAIKIFDSGGTEKTLQQAITDGTLTAVSENPFLFYGLDGTHGAEIGSCEINKEGTGYVTPGNGGPYCDIHGHCGIGFYKGYHARLVVFEDGYWEVSAMRDQQASSTYSVCGAENIGIEENYDTYVLEEEGYASGSCSSWPTSGFEVTSPSGTPAGKTLIKDPESNNKILVDGYTLPQPGESYNLRVLGRTAGSTSPLWGYSNCEVDVP
jgi:hypothetical protein